MCAGEVTGSRIMEPFTGHMTTHIPFLLLSRHASTSMIHAPDKRAHDDCEPRGSFALSPALSHDGTAVGSTAGLGPLCRYDHCRSRLPALAMNPTHAAHD